MKKSYLKLFFAALLLTSFWGCKEEVDTEVLVESVTLDQTSYNLVVGDDFTLTATVSPSDASNLGVNWGSSDSAVATVDSEGNVVAVAEGTAVITAASDENPYISATCTVTVVTDAIPVESLAFDMESLELFIDEVFTLSYTLLPVDATNAEVVWASSDEEVATVVDGTVTAIAAGEATVTVTSVENEEIFASCVVTVKTQVESVALDQESAQFEVGDELQLTATVLPEDATDKTVLWTSSDEAVVTVDAEGIVTAVGGGEATITATSQSNSEAFATFSASVFNAVTEPTAELYNLTAGTYAFSADVRLAGGAQAIVYYATTSSYITGDITATFENYLTSQWYQYFAYENKTIYWKEFSTIIPNSEYVIGYAPANLNEDGSFNSLAGDIQFQYVTTLGYEFGLCDATAAITVNSDAATFSSVSYTLNNDGDCLGAILGYVKTSELTTSVDEYVKNTWLPAQSYLSISTFYSYGDTSYWETLDKTQSSLVDDTEYTVFSIAVSKGGRLGTISSASASTSAMGYNSAYNSTVVLTPGNTSTALNVTIPEGVSRVYYYNGKDYTDDEIKAQLLYNVSNNSTYYSWTSSGDYSISYLTYLYDYTLATISVTEDGSFSEIQFYHYTTVPVDLSSSASVEITNKVYGAHSWSSSEDAYSLTFDATMIDGAVGFYLVELSTYYQTDYDGDGVLSADDCATSVIVGNMASSYYYRSGDGTYSAQTTSAEAVIVVLPVDANGVYGTAILMSKTMDAEDDPVGEYNSAYNSTAVVTPSMTTASVELTIPDGVSKVYYYNATGVTADEAKTTLQGKVESGNAWDTWEKSDTYTISGLSYNTSYVLATMSEAADGSYSELQSYEYTTNDLEFNSSASVSYTKTYGAHSWSSGTDAYSVTLDVKFENGTVGYYFADLTSWYQKDYDGDGVISAEDCAMSMVNGGFISSYYYHDSEGECSGETTAADTYFTLIPVDANGAFGTPIALSKSTDTDL